MLFMYRDNAGIINSFIPVLHEGTNVHNHGLINTIYSLSRQPHWPTYANISTVTVPILLVHWKSDWEGGDITFFQVFVGY